MGKQKAQPQAPPQPDPVESDEEGSEIDPEEVEKQFLQELPEPLKRRTYGLLGLQKQWRTQHSSYMKEMAELEKKYNELLGPLFEKRRAIVMGEEEPSRDEVVAGSKIVDITDEEETKDEKKAEKAGATDVKGIPDFWLTALRNNELIEDTITDRDGAALKYLQNITVKLFANPNEGFQIEFTFSENPFFTDTVLTKSYHLVDDNGDLLMDKAEGCEIDWKADKNLTVQIIKKKQRKGKQTRTVTTTERVDSFFNFFSPPAMPEDDADDDEDEDFDDIEHRIEMDYEIGRILKEKIIPRAVDWFTGSAIPKMDLNFGGMFGEGEEDEEDDEQEQGEGGSGQIAGPPGAKGEECKQQ